MNQNRPSQQYRLARTHYLRTSGICVAYLFFFINNYNSMFGAAIQFNMYSIIINKLFEIRLTLDQKRGQTKSTFSFF